MSQQSYTHDEVMKALTDVDNELDRKDDIIRKFVDFACRVRPLLQEYVESYGTVEEVERFASREMACLKDCEELLELTKEKK